MRSPDIPDMPDMPDMPDIHATQRKTHLETLFPLDRDEREVIV